MTRDIHNELESGMSVSQTLGCWVHSFTARRVGEGELSLVSWCDILVYLLLASPGSAPRGHCSWLPEARFKGAGKVCP